MRVPYIFMIKIHVLFFIISFYERNSLPSCQVIQETKIIILDD